MISRSLVSARQAMLFRARWIDDPGLFHDDAPQIEPEYWRRLAVGNIDIVESRVELVDASDKAVKVVLAAGSGLPGCFLGW